MYLLTDGTTLTVSAAKAELAKVATKVRKAIDTERKSALEVGRLLYQVKSSGLAGVLLTTDETDDVNADSRRTAFASWCASIGIDETQRSRYLAHAKTVDALVVAKVDGAESLTMSATRALAKADDPVKVARKVAKAGAITAPAVLAALPPKDQVPPKVRKAGAIINDILIAADEAPDFGTVSVEDIDRAVRIVESWAADAHALLAKLTS